MSAKGTTIKEALMKWEEKNKTKASEATEIRIYGQIPPIEKMDASLSTLSKCEKLSLSTNCIEKIANLNGLKNLKILSLGRNNIKSLNGLEAVGETLEELWISLNQIEKLKGLLVLKKLKVLYIANNIVRDWAEFVKRVGQNCNHLEVDFLPHGGATSMSELHSLDMLTFGVSIKNAPPPIM